MVMVKKVMTSVLFFFASASTTHDFLSCIASSVAWWFGTSRSKKRIQKIHIFPETGKRQPQFQLLIWRSSPTARTLWSTSQWRQVILTTSKKVCSYEQLAFTRYDCLSAGERCHGNYSNNTLQSIISAINISSRMKHNRRHRPRLYSRSQHRSHRTWFTEKSQNGTRTTVAPHQ